MALSEEKKKKMREAAAAAARKEQDSPAAAVREKEKRRWSDVSPGGNTADFGFVAGALKGAGHTIASGGEAALGVANKLLSKVGIKGAVPDPRGVTERSLATLGAENALTPTTADQKMGYKAEQFGEFFIPGMGPTKAAALGTKLAGKVVPTIARATGSATAGGVAKAIAKQTPRVLSDVGVASGLTALQTEGNAEATLKAGAITAGTPMAAAAGKGILGGVGKIAGAALGHLAVSSPTVLAVAYESALKWIPGRKAAAQYARKAGSSDAELTKMQEDVVQEGLQGLKGMKEQRGNAYRERLAQVATATGQKLDDVLTDLRVKAKELLTRAENAVKVKEKTNKAGQVKKVGLDFSASPLEETSANLKKAYNDIATWKDTSPLGMDNLKKKLDAYIGEAKGGTRAILVQWKNSLRKQLEDKVDGYKDMTHDYHVATELIDDIEGILSLGGTGTKETTVKKLLGIFKENNQMRREFVQILGEQLNEDFEAKLAGMVLSPKVAGGLTGKIGIPQAIGAMGSVAAGQAAEGTMLAKFMVSAGLYLTLTSPRLLAEAANLFGTIARTTGPARKAGLEALRILLIQGAKEDAAREEGASEEAE